MVILFNFWKSAQSQFVASHFATSSDEEAKGLREDLTMSISSSSQTASSMAFDFIESNL